ncbi:MAG: hypothetical protein JF609_11305, partial [Verrucomicrobia bacterium]|nr:hypothetical protein [Verrucomicrobiota bacterium]
MSRRLNPIQKIVWLCVLVFIGVRIWAQSPPANVFTNASQVRSLSVEEAAKALPVILRGVVLADAAGGGSLVIQDGPEAIYVAGQPGQVSKYHRGDLLEVSGVSDPGGFAPIVAIRSCKKIGTETIPEPRRVTFDDLTRKLYDAQYVEINGIVRSSEPSPDPNDVRSRMVIETGGEPLAVRVHVRLATNELVDAEVRVRGICFCRYSASRQFITPVLDIPRG